MKKFLVLATFVFIAVGFFTINSTSSSARESKFKRSVNAIPGQYIVVLNDQAFGESDMQFRTESASYELAGTYGGKVDKVFESAIHGFSAEMSEEDAVSLSKDKRVAFVEENAEIQATSVQADATWGLDRIDQRAYPMNGIYQYSSTGAGVTAYIIDSGIRTTHQDFGGRASVAYDFVGDGQNGNDCFGHGTHVAGTVGSTTYGVAKGVSLKALRVLNCSGSGSVVGIIDAVNWVTANRVLPAVANISITLSGGSNALDNAINNSIASGVTYSIAAGNGSSNACSYSPARVPNALTVGSVVYMDDADWRMSYSNYGPCVDIFAPGNGIVSLSNADDVSPRMMNGTSMAAPHVAGVAALYLQNHPTASPATVAQAIKDGATTGTVTNIDGTSPNKVLYSWLDGAVPPPPPAVVTIIKQVNNASGGTASATQFGYAATNLGDTSFTLVDNDAPPSDRYVTSNVSSLQAAGDVTITESSLAGWTLDAIQCVESGLQNSTVDPVNRKATLKIEAGEQVTCTFHSQELAPTAASATLSGRVVDSRGRGLSGAQVSIRNLTTGSTVLTSTSSFGYYVFENQAVNQAGVIAVKSKRYTFAPSSRTVIPTDNVDGINFVASR